MAKPNLKSMLKRKKQIENEIENLEARIRILEREHREVINFLDLNKRGQDETNVEQSI